MITEEGNITKIIGNKAWVIVKRSSMCDSCGHRKGCISMANSTDMEIEALNTASGKIGDRVIVSLKSSSLLKIALLVYIAPVISLLLGVFIGIEFGNHFSYNPEICSLLFGAFTFIATFIIIKIIGNRMGNERKYIPEVTDILSNLV